MRAEPTGSPDTILVCIRGNSGSGKSSIAHELRRRHGRGCADMTQEASPHPANGCLCALVPRPFVDGESGQEDCPVAGVGVVHSCRRKPLPLM